MGVGQRWASEMDMRVMTRLKIRQQAWAMSALQPVPAAGRKRRSRPWSPEPGATGSWMQAVWDAEGRRLGLSSKPVGPPAVPVT